MNAETDLLARTLKLVEDTLAQGVKDKAVVSENACPDCGAELEIETYPSCKYCRVRWD